jgi:hypothetical protein
MKLLSAQEFLRPTRSKEGLKMNCPKASCPKKGRLFAAVPALLVFAVICICPNAQSENPFNIEDYLPFVADSYWHYTGKNQPNTSTDDDFTWTYNGTRVLLPSSVQVVQIQTTTDAGDDARELDDDFHYRDPATGQLYVYGFRNGMADAAGFFPIQDIILTTPVLLGGRGMSIGDPPVVTSTSTSATVKTPIGDRVVTASATATITYKEFIPVYDTGLGPMTDVLRVEISVAGTIPIPIIGDKTITETGDVFLKKGIGMIAGPNFDLDNPDERQVLDRARVGGVDILPPEEVTYDVTMDTDQVGPAPGQALGAVVPLASNGTASAQLDTVANTLTYQIIINETSSAIQGIEIRGFAARGETGDTMLHSVSTAEPISGVWNYNEDQEYGLLAGLTYFLVKTAANPAGELRGQIDGGTVPETAAAYWEQYD